MDSALSMRITPARRRALEAIRDGYGRCGASRTSGFIVYPGPPVRRDVILVVREANWAFQGTKVPGDPYAYHLVLTDAGRAALDQEHADA